MFEVIFAGLMIVTCVAVAKMVVSVLRLFQKDDIFDVWND